MQLPSPDTALALKIVLGVVSLRLWQNSARYWLPCILVQISEYTLEKHLASQMHPLAMRLLTHSHLLSASMPHSSTLRDLLRDISRVELKCKIYLPFPHTETLSLHSFFPHTHLLFKVPSRFSHVSLQHRNTLLHSQERRMAETHDPCPWNSQPREAGKDRAVWCHSYWALGGAAPTSFPLSASSSPVCLQELLCWFSFFFFLPNFFQHLFLLLAFLSFSIPLRAQSSNTKINLLSLLIWRTNPITLFIPVTQDPQN